MTNSLIFKKEIRKVGIAPHLSFYNSFYTIIMYSIICTVPLFRLFLHLPVDTTFDDLLLTELICSFHFKPSSMKIPIIY